MEITGGSGIMKHLFLYIILASFLFSSCGKKKDAKIQNTQTTERTTETRAGEQTISDTKYLTDKLDALYKNIRISGNVGIYVYDLTDKHEVYGIHEDALMPTASCMKLLTGICAYHYFGTNYHFAPPMICDSTLYPGMNPYVTELDLRKLKDEYRDVSPSLRENVAAEPHWYPWDLSLSRFGLLYRLGNRLKEPIIYKFRDSSAPARFFTAPESSLDAVISRMWKNSSNIMSTSVLYALGRRLSPASTKPEIVGVATLRNFLHSEIGVKDSVQIHDGCGLCPQDRLSPKILTRILTYGYNAPKIRPKMMRLLSISGTDGTLRILLNRRDVAGKIIGKTGTLSHPYGISTLAGFAKRDDGRILVFAVMLSQMSVLDAHVIERNLCKTMLSVDKRKAVTQ